MAVRWRRRAGIIQLTARSLEDFSTRVKKLTRDWTREPWFRGQDARHDLRPKLYREKRENEAEDELRWEFQRRFRLFPMMHPPTTGWEQYFMMQHYGMLTRLLDWTEGALLALYFALRANNGRRDAAGWALDPFWLVEHVVKQINFLPKDHPDYKFIQEYMPDPTDKRTKWIRAHLPRVFSKHAKLPLFPAPLQPPHIDRRIGAQLSAFTIHGARERGLESIARTTPDPRLAVIRIPRANVRNIKYHLAVAGVVETTVFPDLEGLARELTAQYAEPIKKRP
jgi:hypothetical protein